MKTSSGYFKNSFVEHLKSVLPTKIKEMSENCGWRYQDCQNGYARFSEKRIDSIYLEDIRDADGNNVILKFNYRLFDHIPNLPADFVFSRVYLCGTDFSQGGDSCLEYGYDKELNRSAVYLKWPHLEANLGREDLSHILDILIEWREGMRLFHKGESEHWIMCYQIEKDGERVKNPYVAIAPLDRLGNPVSVPNPDGAHRFEILHDIAEDFDIDDADWAFKGFPNDEGEIEGHIIFNLGGDRARVRRADHYFMNLW